MPRPIAVESTSVFRCSIGDECEQHTHFTFQVHSGGHFRAWHVKTGGEVGSGGSPDLPYVVLDALTPRGDHHAGPVSSSLGEHR